MSPPPTSIDGTDITGATIDGQQVQEITIDGETVFVAESLPTSVTSRPNDTRIGDNLTFTRGLVIEPKEDFTKIAARVSRNSTGVSRYRVFDYSSSSFVVNESGQNLTGGDTFIIEHQFQTGTQYGISVDNDGSQWDIGFAKDEKNYPYTGTEIDIVGREKGGSQDTGETSGLNDIGNPDNVLG